MKPPQTPEEWRDLLLSGVPLTPRNTVHLVKWIEALTLRIQWLQLAVAERDRWASLHVCLPNRLRPQDLTRLASECQDPDQPLGISWTLLSAAINNILHPECPNAHHR